MSTPKIRPSEYPFNQPLITRTKKNMKIEDIIHIQNMPNHYAEIYPFSVILHVPGLYQLTPAEEAVINEAVVDAAAKIRKMRGQGECNFAWFTGKKIDWKRERLSPGLKTKSDAAINAAMKEGSK